ncbi:MAG: hypothetical protein K2X66_06950, partial [Cyanobacteria bacterium]|nr:hypothetical protein [Cyanobacteriota bacterium]
HTYCQERQTCLSSFIRDNLPHLSPQTSSQLLEAYRFCIIQPFADIFQEGLELKILNKSLSQTMSAEDLAILCISMLDSLLFKSHFFKSSGQDEPGIPENAKESTRLNPIQTTSCPKIQGIVQILLHGI